MKMFIGYNWGYIQEIEVIKETPASVYLADNRRESKTKPNYRKFFHSFTEAFEYCARELQTRVDSELKRQKDFFEKNQERYNAEKKGIKT